MRVTWLHQKYKPNPVKDFYEPDLVPDGAPIQRYGTVVGYVGLSLHDVRAVVVLGDNSVESINIKELTVIDLHLNDWAIGNKIEWVVDGGGGAGVIEQVNNISVVVRRILSNGQMAATLQDVTRRNIVRKLP